MLLWVLFVVNHFQEVVELAALTADQQAFQELVCPLGKVPEGASNLHHLTFDKLCHTPPLPVVLLTWIKWLQQQCEQAPGGACRLVLAGHNIRK